MKIKDSLPPFRDIDLERLQTEIGAILPPELIAFLRKHNGGHPERSVYSSPNGDEDIEVILGIGKDKEYGTIMEEYLLSRTLLHHSFIPIATNGCGDLICIGVNGENSGKIYLWLHELADPEHCVLSPKEIVKDEAYHHMAESLNEFLSKLKSLAIEE